MGTEKRERQKANRALKQQQIEQQASRRKAVRTGLIVLGAIVAVFLLVWVASNVVGDDDASPAQVVASAPPLDDGTGAPATAGISASAVSDG